MIVTGFLGAGKTTLLNRLLLDARLARAVVFINEFGDIGLDHLFVKKIDDDMILMASGCLCCTIRGELIDALENLLRERDNGRLGEFDRVIIETTGLADPAPILHTFMSHPYLLLRFRLDGVVTVVDAINGAETLENYPEALKQAAIADRLVVSKSDLINSEDLRHRRERLFTRLAKLNPTARLLDNSHDFDVKNLLDAGLFDPSTKSPQVANWLNIEKLLLERRSPGQGESIACGHDHVHEHDEVHAHAVENERAEINRHGEAIRSFCLVSESALALSACNLFLEMLRSAHGPNLLRIKGVIALADDLSRPLVIHGVQHIFHPPVRLESWPDSDHRTRIVFIVKDLDPNFVEGLYSAFAGQIAVGAADAQALATNPLKPSLDGLLR